MKPILLCFTICALLTACSKQVPTTSEVQAKIERVLSIGDPREKIEIELEKMGIQTDYDRFRNRYQAGVSTNSKSRNIAIWIYLDEERKTIERIETEDVFTLL